MEQPGRVAAVPDVELDALLELKVLPGMGDVRLRQLLARYGSANAVLQAPAAAIGPEAARARGSARVRGRVERARAVVERERVAVLAVHGPTYPERLHHLTDPPCVLFARGRIELLKLPVVTIVGARRCTHYGRYAARTLAADLTRSGVPVASGLARGIDAAAHEGALPDTIAVLGCGIDVPYPWENRLLQERIAEEGLLLSEFAPGEPAIGHHFPRRNRILAALARGIVVVEAGEKSGSIITADHGLDLGREVFCAPPNIGRLNSPGVQRLVDDGARLVTTAAQIMDEIGVRLLDSGTPAAAAAAPWDADVMELSEEADRMLGILYTEALHIDELAAAARLSPEAALAGLLRLEVRGLVRQLPGMRFIAVPERLADARKPRPRPGLP